MRPPSPRLGRLTLLANANGVRVAQRLQEIFVDEEEDEEEEVGPYVLMYQHWWIVGV